MKIRLALALVFLCVLAPSTPALELDEPTKDWSFQIGGGSSFLPGFEFTQVTRLGYRLPWDDQRIEAILDITSGPFIVFGGFDQITLAGQYHFSPHADLRPFLSAGLSYLPLRHGLWALQVGAGADLMWSANFGWSPQLRVQIPPSDPNLTIINTDIALKWHF